MSIYILRLIKKKWYIGKSSNIQNRIINHFSTNGSEWTKIYKPIKVEKVIKDISPFDEEKYTFQYMEKYGIDNVRGGAFCKVNLDSTEKGILERILSSNSDKCYNCGMVGHFISRCPSKKETLERQSKKRKRDFN